MTRDTPKRGLLWRLRRLFYLGLLVLVGGVAAAVLVLSRVELPDDTEVRLAETSVVHDRNGQVIAHLHAEQDRFYRTIDEMSQPLIDAVVAAEDRDFFDHAGVDPMGIARALWNDIRSGSASQGGSTITQQYVKNVYLDSERTLTRKLREAVMAIKLERRYSKAEILERYLNTIYFGRGAYGVEAAARAYFGVSALELGPGEAAYLAGLIRAPESADVSRPEQAAEAQRRRDSVLWAMAEEGYVTETEASALVARPLGDYTLPRSEATSVRIVAGGEIGIAHVVDQVRKELLERYDDAAVYGRGLEIHTTIDLEAQRAAYEAVREMLPEADGPTAAVVVLDDQGQVRAMVGGPDFDVSQVNLALGAAGGGSGRQPGSAFKPIVLAEALDRGYSMSSLFESPGSIVIPGADGGRDWTVANYGGASHGVVDLLGATKVSSNTVFAQLVDLVDPAAVVARANAMGVASRLEPVHSIALGAQEVSVLDMAVAYSVFANRGERVTPLLVSEVVGGGGRETFSSSRDRVLPTQVADSVTTALVGVVEGGTGRGAAVPGVPVAGKTGTTQDYGDAWFVGYTPKFTAAVWVGYRDRVEPMLNVAGHGQVTGGTIPAEIFSRVVARVTDGTDPGSFTLVSEFHGDIHNAHLGTTTTTSPGTSTTSTTAPSDSTTSTTAATSTTSATTTTTTSPATSTTIVATTSDPAPASGDGS